MPTTVFVSQKPSNTCLWMSKSVALFILLTTGSFLPEILNQEMLPALVVLIFGLLVAAFFINKAIDRVLLPFCLMIDPIGRLKFAQHTRNSMDRIPDKISHDVQTVRFIKSAYHGIGFILLELILEDASEVPVLITSDSFPAADYQALSVLLRRITLQTDHAQGNSV